MNPISRFLRLKNRPLIDSHGETTNGPLELHYWEWQGRHPTFLICHGGMLHGRCYDRIIQRALPGFHVIALDLRGHGQSQKHPLPYPFPWFGGDVLDFIEQLHLNEQPLFGVAHSLGAHAMVQAASIASKRLFQSILLLDPAIYSSSVYESTTKPIDILNLVPDRKDQYASIDDMFTNLNKPGRLGHWPSDVLRDYCTYALNEQCRLQCTPKLAAYLYLASTQPESNIYSMIKTAKHIHETPIRVLRAPISILNHRLAVTPTAADLARWFGQGEDTLLASHVTHSFPTEEPELVIYFLQKMLKANRELFAHL